VIRHPVAFLVAIALVAVAFAQPVPLAQTSGTTSSPYLFARAVRVVTLEAATRSGIEAQVNSWLTGNPTKRVLGPVQIARDSANYEVIGSRGSVQVWTAAITYAP
jgi:hypothetical protein